jgi:hypothetical protein
LLTVHGAKGLEARAVFVIDADSDVPQAERATLLVDWPVDRSAPRRLAFIRSEARVPASLAELFREESTARQREEINGLYVAMTRAREWLFFSRTEPQSVAPRTWWRRVEGVAQDSTAGAPREWPAPHRAASSGGLVAVPVLPTLKHGARAVGPAVLPYDPVAARLGQAVHRVLEWAGRPGAPALDLAAAAAAAGQPLGLPAGAAAEIAAIAGAVLSSPACVQFFSGAALRWAANEVPVAEDGDTLRIDRLVALAGPGGKTTWWVLDYKLQLPRAALPAYHTQLRRYVAAVRLLQPNDEVRAGLHHWAGGIGRIPGVARARHNCACLGPLFSASRLPAARSNAPGMPAPISDAPHSARTNGSAPGNATGNPNANIVVRWFGPRQLLRLLGKSERTMAWRVVDPGSSRELMLMLPRVQPADATALESWLQSARRAARLNHPQLAAVVEVGVQDGWPFVAYDPRDASTLAERLSPKGLPGLEAAAVTTQVLQGLAFAHEAGVVHHDLQPWSVLVSDSGQVRLAGLEVAAELAAQRTPPVGDTALLTLQREAAERDVLAGGLLLHHLLSGHPVLDEPDLGRVIARLPPYCGNHGRESVRLPWTVAHPTPEPLRAIVNRATDRQPRQRYRNARTLLGALEGWQRIESGTSGGPLVLLADRLRAAGVLPASPGAAERAAGWRSWKRNGRWSWPPWCWKTWRFPSKCCAWSTQPRCAARKSRAAARC